ncbi:hypothetical protein [Streptomyces sp. NPDC091217]|uniref:hypothetical protein n=1 Tax=Streptomyces sp. NPDC091217 TaxID=3365975 RepID=UPI0037F4ED82
MTPTLRPYSPKGDPTPAKRNRTYDPASRSRADTRIRETRRPGNLISVWLVAQQSSHPDAHLIEPWLLETIVQIVTVYTRPGDGVLLLAPPTGPGESGPDPATPGTRAGGGPLPALIEAAQAGSRLGATLEVRTAISDFAVHAAEHTSPAEPQSVHRLSSRSISPAPTGRQPGRDPNTVGPDRFDAVIVLYDPRDPDWLATIPWGGLVTPSGVLAFITLSDFPLGDQVDPEGFVTRIADHAGLAPLDRVVLLQTPVREGALVPRPELPDPAPADTALCAAVARHTRVHADLLLFARPRQAGGPVREERR